MNCPELECVGVLLVWVGRGARSFAGDPHHNPGSDRRPDPRLATQPRMRRTRPVPRCDEEGDQDHQYGDTHPRWCCRLGLDQRRRWPPDLVTGCCPSIRHWHSVRVTRSLVPVPVRPRPPTGTGTTLTAPRDLGGPRVHTAESVPTPWESCDAPPTNPPHPVPSPCAGSRGHSPSR